MIHDILQDRITSDGRLITDPQNRVDTDAAQASTDPAAAAPKRAAGVPSTAPATDPISNSELAELVDFVTGCKRLVVLTGAGCSTESNIPDYRGPKGAYSTGFQPMTHQQVHHMAHCPIIVHNCKNTMGTTFMLLPVVTAALVATVIKVSSFALCLAAVAVNSWHLSSTASGAFPMSPEVATMHPTKGCHTACHNGHTAQVRVGFPACSSWQQRSEGQGTGPGALQDGMSLLQ